MTVAILILASLAVRPRGRARGPGMTALTPTHDGARPR
jgi:hypothetical protein